MDTHRWYRRRKRRSPVQWTAPTGADRQAGPLYVRTLGNHEDPPIVLLHGLVGSGFFWGGHYDELSSGHFLVVPDLLGFGRSEKPSSGYGVTEHLAAITTCLDILGVERPVTIGAHSLGCILAIHLAHQRPDLVQQLVGFGPPIYSSTAAAEAHISASGGMGRLLRLPTPVGRSACALMCAHRELAGHLAVVTHPGLPAPIARDAVNHTWPSYSQTLQRVLLDAGSSPLLPELNTSALLIAGRIDPVIDVDFLTEAAPTWPAVRLEVWPGDHHLPLTDPDRCRTVIQEATDPN